VFHIVRGKVAVTIHDDKSVMESGDMFFVPVGEWLSLFVILCCSLPVIPCCTVIRRTVMSL